jgi:hypothetical protein
MKRFLVQNFTSTIASQAHLTPPLEMLKLLLWPVRRSQGYIVKFEPTEAILAYGFVGIHIEEIDEHELVRMTCKIIRKRIYKMLLTLQVGSIETFTKIQSMWSLPRVEAHPVMGSLRSKGVQPFLVLCNFCGSLLELVTADRRGVKNDTRENEETSNDKCFHDSLQLDFRHNYAKPLPFAKEFSQEIPVSSNSGSFVKIGESNQAIGGNYRSR